jgi:hypothetical protein
MVAMVMLEGLLVVGVIGFLLYVVIQALLSRQESPPTGVGHWRVSHYDVEGRTRVVVCKVRSGGQVLDEHLIAEIPVDDPAYDELFMTAMATARERKAMFETEE